MPAAIEFSVDRSQLERELHRIETEYLKAERRAVAETTREAEQALEGATAAAGLGRLGRAWTSKVYPIGGLAREPVGYIFPKGGRRTEGAMRSFSRGARIRALDGGPVAIPLPAAGGRGRGGGLTPEEWERKTGQKLRPVYRRGKAPLLVADGRVNMRTGRFRKSLKRDARRIGPGYGAVVPIFVLMPQVNLSARFSIEGTLAPFPGRVAAAFVQLANAIK
ncbi:MAG TPA: DUF6441 family protein [Allosphingosinicella sp.]|jgi:hypothetical protein|nr:DUF6441 family protein [Allosphingosinicella sp.]